MEFNDQSKLHRFLAKWFIRLKILKRSPFDFSDVNPEINTLLPTSFMIIIPGGSGELTIDEAKLNVDTETIVAEVLCHLKVIVARNTIYNAYIRLTLDGKLDYSKTDKIISPKDVRVLSTQLISDDRSMIKDTRKLIIDLLPEPIKTLFISTLVMSDSIVKTIGINEMAKYLSLYLSGSKQRILDYHHEEIETKIVDYLNSEAFNYELDDTIFEEQLFAQFGEEVIIEDGQVFFVFHPEN